MISLCRIEVCSEATPRSTIAVCLPLATGLTGSINFYEATRFRRRNRPLKKRPGTRDGHDQLLTVLTVYSLFRITLLRGRFGVPNFLV
jgi:hypothetical protein